MTVQVTG